MISNPVVYVFLNKSLHMSVGKASAQVAHAVIMSLAGKDTKDWVNAIHKTVIVLDSKDQTQMQSIYSYLLQRNFSMEMVIDEGINEIEPFTITAMASQILDKDDESVIKAFGSFKVYKEIIKINMEFEK